MICAVLSGIEDETDGAKGDLAVAERRPSGGPAPVGAPLHPPFQNQSLKPQPTERRVSFLLFERDIRDYSDRVTRTYRFVSKQQLLVVTLCHSFCGSQVHLNSQYSAILYSLFCLCDNVLWNINWNIRLWHELYCCLWHTSMSMCDLWYKILSYFNHCLSLK